MESFSTVWICKKFNWNVVVNKPNNEVGIGIIVRDHNGELLKSRMAFKPYIIDSGIDDQVLAAFAIVIFRRDVELKKVVLKGDVFTLKEQVNLKFF
jgi:hypothetical protein